LGRVPKEGRSKVLKAKYTLSTTPAGDEIKVRAEREFETISDLEDFIAYNRAYFMKLQFQGSFKKEQD
jgi:hypothetical protein